MLDDELLAIIVTLLMNNSFFLKKEENLNIYEMKNFVDEKNTYRYLIVVSKIKQSIIIQSQPGLSSVYTVCAKYWGPDTRHQTSCCQLQTAAAAGPPLSLTLISTPSKQYSG